MARKRKRKSKNPKNSKVKTMELNPTENEYIKIHGLQRSGTNYLTYLLRASFKKLEVLVNAGGWKHGPYSLPYMLGDNEINVAIIAKSPYAWLTSVYDYWSPPKQFEVGPDLENVSFEEFVREKAVLEMQKTIPFMFRAANMVQYWNNMYYHWLTIRMQKKEILYINYEGLLENPESSIQNIAKLLKLELKENRKVKCDKVFTPSGERLIISDKNWERKNHYLNKEYLKSFSPELMDFVNKELDTDVMKSFGYVLEKSPIK